MDEWQEPRREPRERTAARRTQDYEVVGVVARGQPPRRRLDARAGDATTELAGVLVPGGTIARLTQRNDGVRAFLVRRG